MVQQYKIDKIKYLIEFFDANKSFIFNDYSGLNVEKITKLRNELKKISSKFIVVKNNFICKILKDKKFPDMENNLTGPTAIAFINNNVSEVLKVLYDFAKKSTLKVKGGWTEDRIFNEKELNDLSKLPGKNQLIAMFMATLNAPLQNFVYACNDVIGRFVRVLRAVEDSKK